MCESPPQPPPTCSTYLWLVPVLLGQLLPIPARPYTHIHTCTHASDTRSYIIPSSRTHPTHTRTSSSHLCTHTHPTYTHTRTPGYRTHPLPIWTQSARSALSWQVRPRTLRAARRGGAQRPSGTELPSRPAREHTSAYGRPNPPRQPSRGGQRPHRRREDECAGSADSVAPVPARRTRKDPPGRYCLRMYAQGPQVRSSAYSSRAEPSRGGHTAETSPAK